jgi:hypothetical protein
MSATPEIPRPECARVHSKLDQFIASGKIPNLIFHGSAGTGKQSLLAHFLSRVYGGDKHKIRTNTMSVNCAHGKGIKFIREDLKNFAKTNINVGTGILFKSIVLLKADHLTIDAQSALRRCIELFSNNTRFFLVVENKSLLFNPILSRFCEIYVPDAAFGETDLVENLHARAIRIAYPPRPKEYLDAATFAVRESLDENKSGIVLLTVDRATALYEQGVCARDVARAIGTSADIDESQRANIMLAYYKSKAEFRNEKTLIFYLLHLSSLTTAPRCEAGMQDVCA